MLAQALKSARRTLPLSNWTIATAAIWGLALGAANLGESLDMATAMGISGFLSIAVGCWLAIHLYQLLMRGYVAWIALIETRADGILSLLPVSPSTEEPDADDVRRASVAARVVAGSFYFTMCASGAFTSCLLYTGLTYQIVDRTVILHFTPIAMISLVLGIIIAAQSLYFVRLHWKIASIERQMQRIDMVPQVTGRTAILGISITRTERFGRRFVGLPSGSSEQTAV